MINEKTDSTTLAMMTPNVEASIILKKLFIAFVFFMDDNIDTIQSE
jgi:uncharacterized protein YehS (DUF1456 family)